MEVINNYLKKIEVIERLTLPLLNETAKADAIEASNDLKNQLIGSSFIKVPFVGEFNASKSSLLNAYMDRELLPTNITPETAVSYELYYSETERLDVWHYDTLKLTAPLEKIKEIAVVPGDIVKVYINNSKIKNLNERGIVVVDMPGIDSGVEEHNNAILNYIQEGTFYVIVSDIQHGTLTSSSLQFVQELKKYSISAAVLISKIDRKPDDEVAKVLTSVKDLAERLIGKGTFVGGVSTISNKMKDMETLLDGLNGEEFAEKKFNDKVNTFVNKQMAQLQFQMNLLASNASNFDAQIKMLESKRDEALKRLEVNDRDAQPIDGSVQDILDDVNTALFLNAYQLASTLYVNNDAKSLNNQVLSIIRPVLVKSFQREIGEYQEVIGKTINDLSDDIESILKDENNPLVQQAENVVENLIGRELLEEFLTKGIEALMARFAGYKAISGLLGMIGKVLNPLVGILIGFIPDILRLIFGKGKSEKINEIQQQLEARAFGQIIEAMREPITDMIENQRKESYNGLKKAIKDEINSINASLEEAKIQKEADEAKNNEMIEQIKIAIQQIKLELSI